MTSSRISSGKLQRAAADWAEFYKNGQPQEVIIINDDTPPPYASSSSSASSSVSSSHPNHNQYQQVPSHHHYHHSQSNNHRHPPSSNDRHLQQQQQHSYHNSSHRSSNNNHHLAYPQEYDYHGSPPRSHGIVAPPPRPSQTISLNRSGHASNSNNHNNSDYVQERPYSPGSNTYHNNSSNGSISNGHYHPLNNNNSISSASASMPSSTIYAPSSGSSTTVGRLTRRTSRRQPSSADQNPFDPTPASMPQYTYPHYLAPEDMLPHHPQHHHHHRHDRPPAPLEPVYHPDSRDYGYPAPYPSIDHQSHHHIHLNPYRDLTPSLNGSGYPPPPPPPLLDMHHLHPGLSPVPKKRRTVNVPIRGGSGSGAQPYGQETMHNPSRPAYSGSMRQHQQHHPLYPDESPPHQAHAIYPVVDPTAPQLSSSLKRKMKAEEQEWSTMAAKRNGGSKYRAAPPAPLSESHQNGAPYYLAPPPPAQPQQPPPLPPPSTQVRVAPPPPSTATVQAPAPIIPPWDDKEGHYIVVPNEDLTPRYKIIRLLGQGTFGKVVECYDRETGGRCAIKVIRAVQKYRDASKIEARVLSTLKKSDPKNTFNCLHLIEIFDFRNHVCMVFELLGQSIYDWLKDNSFCPFPPNQIQQFAKQLLTSVAFLHRLRLIHTDLKPENILLADGSFRQVPYKTTPRGPAKMKKILLRPDIRLIDFGSATFQEEHHSTVVSTRHYRAPEIILGLGWSYPCDIWSIGCILVELLTGEALFQTHDNLEHLAMMQAVLGEIPDKLIRASHKTAQKFFVRGRLDYPNEETKRNSRKFVKALRPLEDYVVQAGNTMDQEDFRHDFVDLLKRLLAYDPSERVTAAQALRHPYFRYVVDEHGLILDVPQPF